MTFTLRDLVYAYGAVVCTILIYALGSSLRLKIQLKNHTIDPKEYVKERVKVSLMAWSWWTVSGFVALLVYFALR